MILLGFIGIYALNYFFGSILSFLIGRFGSLGFVSWVIFFFIFFNSDFKRERFWEV